MTLRVWKTIFMSHRHSRNLIIFCLSKKLENQLRQSNVNSYYFLDFICLCNIRQMKKIYLLQLQTDKHLWRTKRSNYLSCLFRFHNTFSSMQESSRLLWTMLHCDYWKWHWFEFVIFLKHSKDDTFDLIISNFLFASCTVLISQWFDEFLR